MPNVVKSAFKPFLDEFEKIGSQTASQAVQAVKGVASDVVQKPIQEAVGNKTMGPVGTGTNEQGNQTQQQMQQAATAKAQQDDQAKAQQQIAQIRQNLKALMEPPKPPPEKPIYYKMWEEKKQEEQKQEEIKYKKKEDAAAIKAAGHSTGEIKRGVGG